MKPRLVSAALSVAAALLVSVPADRAGAAKGDITLLGQLLPVGMDQICDIWGYVDPQGVHYAIMGDWGNPSGGGIYIINVEDPANPFVAKTIIGNGVYGFDVKVWQHYLYACDGYLGGNNSSKVYNIIDIANPVASAGFPDHHNFAIHPDGYLYGEVPGLAAYDIATNPMAPAFKWATDFSNGHDSTPIGDRLYDFHGYAGTNIYDISNRLNPVLLGSITDPNMTYHHSGWPTPDGNYLYICDELAQHPKADITVWNIGNPAAPFKVASLADGSATVHNLYIVGGFAFVAHYSAGFRVYDVSLPTAPVLLDTWDTSAFTGENYEGNFGVYAFADNGVIYASDWDNGLYLFSVEGYNPPPTSVDGPAPKPAAARLVGNYPNPFNPSTTVAFELSRREQVSLAIYDLRGRLVRVLADGVRAGGRHDVAWDGLDRSGVRAASGVYFARLEASGGTDTRRLVLLK